MKYISRVQNKEFKISLKEKNGQLFAKLGTEQIPIQLFKTSGHSVYSALIGKRSFEVEIVKNDSDYLLHYRGNNFKIAVEDERLLHLKKFTGNLKTDMHEKELKAPMPGLVVAIEVSEGQAVKQGDGLIIFEAMKMENELNAPFDAVIKKITTKTGTAVDKNQTLILFE